MTSFLIDLPFCAFGLGTSPFDRSGRIRLMYPAAITRYEREREERMKDEPLLG
jgi:hypothetical protein